MIELYLQMLELNKKMKTKQRYTGIALGDNKLPMSYREALKLFKRNLWQKEDRSN